MITRTKLTPMQARAVEVLTDDPDIGPDRLVEVVGVKGGQDNQAVFLMRLVRTGAVRFVVTGTDRG